MATMDEKIASLEAEIKRSRVDLENASTPQEKRVMREFITGARRILKRLVDQKAQNQGTLS
jgi:hypothetical protein